MSAVGSSDDGVISLPPAPAPDRPLGWGRRRRRLRRPDADGPESPRVLVNASSLDAYARDTEPEAVRSALAAYLALWRHAGARGTALSTDREMNRIAVATAEALLPDWYR